MDYIDCELSIKDDRNISFKVKEFFLEVSCQIVSDPLSLKTIERFKFWLQNENWDCKRDDLAVLGEHLYHLLFETTVDETKGYNVRQAFEQVWERFEDRRKKDEHLRLRLVLIFHKGVVKWSGYPWEYLYMPIEPEGFFLAGEKTQLILTRFVPEARVDYVTRDEGPLKILIAGSGPRELGKIDSGDIMSEIACLKSGEIEVRNLGMRTTFNQLHDEVKLFQPDIVHFLGHGMPGLIAFIKEAKDLEEEEKLLGKGLAKETEWVDSKTVSVLFDEHQPRLVFLHACKGATTASWDTFKSTARDLVYANIPAVVAMQYSISNQDALEFARTFYQQIGDGKYIDEAVTAARRRLGTYKVNRGAWNDRSFGVPVVYMQWQSETPIVKPKKVKEIKDSGEGQEQPQPAVQEKIPCPNPDCRGFVTVGQVRCLKCRHQIEACPNCGNLMSKNVGACGFCEYEIGAAASLPQAPTSDSVQLR